MENMKIGIDCHNLEGQRTGVGRYLWNLLQEFNRTGSDPVRSFFYILKAKYLRIFKSWLKMAKVLNILTIVRIFK